jgi:hypothetical protein
MHRSTDVQVDRQKAAPLSVSWEGVQSVSEWLCGQPHNLWKQQFDEAGVVKIEHLINENELEIYRGLYDKLMNGEVDVSAHRHDLGNHIDRKTVVENICQIMWPSVYVSGLDQGPIHQRVLAISRIVLGDDMDFDFDMLISKGPHTDTETPWHQDASYWVDMPDKRALSFWVAIDKSTVDNGCMWFVPGSHGEPELRPHRFVQPGVHVRICDCSEDQGKPYPLEPGSATLHHGHTLHYSRGNSTDLPRRAFIINCRPSAMVAYERAKGFDHGQKGLQGIFDLDKQVTA